MPLRTGYIVPAASHRAVASAACAGRLPATEHRVLSIGYLLSSNNHSSDFVSHHGEPEGRDVFGRRQQKQIHAPVLLFRYEVARQSGCAPRSTPGYYPLLQQINDLLGHNRVGVHRSISFAAPACIKCTDSHRSFATVRRASLGRIVQDEHEHFPPRPLKKIGGRGGKIRGAEELSG